MAWVVGGGGGKVGRVATEAKPFGCVGVERWGRIWEKGVGKWSAQQGLNKEPTTRTEQTTKLTLPIWPLRPLMHRLICADCCAGQPA